MGRVFTIDRKISPEFPKHNSKQLLVYCRILTLAAVSSHLMTNEDRGCQHVAMKSRIKLKNFVLNSKGQIFKRSLASV